MTSCLIVSSATECNEYCILSPVRVHDCVWNYTRPSLSQSVAKTANIILSVGSGCSAAREIGEEEGAGEGMNGLSSPGCCSKVLKQDLFFVLDALALGYWVVLHARDLRE